MIDAIAEAFAVIFGALMLLAVVADIWLAFKAPHLAKTWKELQ